MTILDEATIKIIFAEIAATGIRDGILRNLHERAQVNEAARMAAVKTGR